MAEARQFIADGYGSQILKVELPDNPREVNIVMVTVDEGYPAVVGHIPAEYINKM